MDGPMSAQCVDIGLLFLLFEVLAMICKKLKGIFLKSKHTHPKICIQRVPIWQIQNIIEYRHPNGYFLSQSGSLWVAVDNSTGDAWTEDFDSKYQAIHWLRGDFEVGDLSRS